MANHFHLDAVANRAVALWNCDGGALLTDSYGGNNFTQRESTSVIYPTTGPPKAGGSSIAWSKLGDDNYYHWAVPTPAVTFPYHTGNANTDMSLCFWLKLSGDVALRKVIYHWSGREFQYDDWSDGAFYKGSQLQIGWTGQVPNTDPVPTSYKFTVITYPLNVVLATDAQRLLPDVWYHVGISITDNGDSTSNCLLRIWNDSSQTLHYNALTTPAGNIVTNPGLIRWYASGAYLATYFPEGSNHIDYWDEIVFFNRALSSNEIDLIRQGLYPQAHRIEGQSSVENTGSNRHTAPGAHMQLSASGSLSGISFPLGDALILGEANLTSADLISVGEKQHAYILATADLSPILSGTLLDLDLTQILATGTITQAELSYLVIKCAGTIDIQSNIPDTTLRNATRWLQGSIDGSSSFSAVTLDIFHPGPIYVELGPAGVIAIQSNVSGWLSFPGEMYSWWAGYLLITPSMSVEYELVGTVASTSNITADMEDYISLVGSWGNTAKVNGHLSVTKEFAGSIDSTSDFVTWLDLPGALRGRIDIQSSITGQPLTEVNLVGTIDIVSFFTGWIGFPGEMRAEFAIQSTFGGNLLRVDFLDGPINAQSSITGGLSLESALTGQITSLSTINVFLDYALADFLISRYSVKPILQHLTRVKKRLTDSEL
jgi:hypothetical protein